MSWVTPMFSEIDMSAEIGSYQDDFDRPTEPAFITPESEVAAETAIGAASDVG